MKLRTIALLLLVIPLMAEGTIALDLIFESRIDYPAGSRPSSIHAGDFDGDGSSDLVVTNLHSSSITILRNNGDGTFAAGDAYGVGTYPTSVCASDLDGDGNLDMIVANKGSGTISILDNNGDGTFAAPVDYGSFYSPGSVCAADFNGSGKPDLAVGHSNDIVILGNNGDGTFASPSQYNLFGGGYSSCVVATDIDGDGIPDLVLTRWGQQPDAPSNVAILKNNGNGTFATAVYYGSWLDPSCVCAADFDGDAKPDLAITHAFGVSTLKNNGDGTFADAIDYAIGRHPPSIFASDFDLDDRPDLAVANSSAYDISILVNNGDGTFGDAIDYSDRGSPISVFADDFNNDGKPDLAVANYDSNSVSVLINRSSFPNDVDGPHQTIIPEDFQLNQNYPNPFNPVTTIEYFIPRASTVTLTIYDILGQTVKMLVNERKEAGHYSVLWDGKDNNGHLVVSGVYFYHLEAGEFVKSHKMLLLK